MQMILQLYPTGETLFGRVQVNLHFGLGMDKPEFHFPNGTKILHESKDWEKHRNWTQITLCYVRTVLPTLDYTSDALPNVRPTWTPGWTSANPKRGQIISRGMKVIDLPIESNPLP